MRETALILFAAFTLVHRSSPFSAPFLRREDIAGVWRFAPTESFLPRVEVRQEAEPDVLLTLLEDGSFSRCGDDSEESSKAKGSIAKSGSTLGLGYFLLRGSWNYVDRSLILAPDRPPGTDGRMIHDTILVGEVIADVKESLSDNPAVVSSTGGSAKNLDKDVFLSISCGDICIGKFMYPRSHRSFFEQPMLYGPKKTGSFELRQVLGSLNTNFKEEPAKPAVQKYHKKDFYGRKFFLTTVPAGPWVGMDHWTGQGGEKESQELSSYDIRVIPIEFHSNNTFSAIGSNKILRGRFGTCGEEKDQLWFQVSLFGAGRSAPGSVYSEGNGLSQEDRRGYSGMIEEEGEESRKSSDLNYNDGNNGVAPPGGSKTFVVRGKVWIGTDFARDENRRPPPDSTFTMREVAEFGTGNEEFDDDDDSLESEFE